MRKLVVLGLLFVNSVAFGAASSVTAAGISASPVKRTETITLKQAPADFIIRVLEIGKDGKPTNAQARLKMGIRGLSLPGGFSLLLDPTFAADCTCEVPAGIDSIVPKTANSLIIKGTAAAIADLKSTINLLDIKPGLASFKVEFYELTAEQVAQHLSGDKLEKLITTSFSEADINAFKADVLAATPSVSEPARCVYNNCTDEFAINLETGAEIKDIKNLRSAAAMIYRPRVNKDGSVTTSLCATLTVMDSMTAIKEDGTEVPITAPRQTTFTTNRRCQSGETFVITSNGYKQPGRMLLMLVTPTIISNDPIPTD